MLSESHASDNVVNLPARVSIEVCSLASLDAHFIILPMTRAFAKRSLLRRYEFTARAIATLVLIVIGATIATRVRAIEEMALSIDEIAGDGWVATGVAVDLGLIDERSQARATVGRLHLATFKQTLKDVRIECTKLEVTAETIACSKGRVLADWPALGKQSLTARLRYGRRDGSLDVALDGMQIGTGRASLQVSLRQARWNGQVTLRKVPIERLTQLAKDFSLPVPTLAGTGHLDMTASARGAQAKLDEAQLEASLLELTANNESGSLATDKLSLQLQATLRGSQADWQFDVDVRSAHGQAFAQPIFLDLSVHPLSVSARGRFKEGGTLTLQRFVFEHTDVARGSGTAQIEFDHEQPVRDLQLQLASLQFPGAYESYLQPLLLDTSFKALQTAGSIDGVVRVENGQPQQIALNFADVTVDDGTGNLNLSALGGRWRWRAEPPSTARDGDDERAASAATELSQLQWSGGALLGLQLGPSELQFTTRGRQFRLMRPARIPVLDGSIDLDTFRVRNVGMHTVAFLVDATLQPISVQKLCKAFGWPEFGGRIGGAISKLRMREGIVTLGTTLRAQVFNGEVSISDLRLEQPFGQWPRFSSNIALDRLDLEPMTEAFSFGRITGRVSGYIHGLQLFNWVPTEFDARLFTPPDDRSRHRISQRAVENIGSIGGGGAGVTAALSSGFLRFFDDFNYDRLGISCRLQNEVCVMDGIAPAANGNYYLVKGKGLPRIDVIGNSRRIDWPRLVQQLIAVTESEGPVVQ